MRYLAHDKARLAAVPLPIAVALAPLCFILLACGQIMPTPTFTPQPTPTPIPTRTPTPEPRSGEGLQLEYREPPVSLHGDTIIEQKILESDTIVRAAMTSLSSEVGVKADGKYRVILKFNLSVREYLMGTGPSSIVAVWADGRSYATSSQANDRMAAILADRDSQWDDREAVLFLLSTAIGYGTVLDGQFKLADHFSLGLGHHILDDDRYSLHSESDRFWLPSATANGASGESGSDSLEYLLAVPSSSVGVSGVRVVTPTVTLANLKKRIKGVTAELSAGDGSEAYKECIREKYALEQEDAYFRELDGRGAYPNDLEFSKLVSGQPAGTVLHQRPSTGNYPDQKSKTWLEGSYAALISIAQGEATPYDIDWDGKLTAGVDGLREGLNKWGSAVFFELVDV